MLTPNFPRASSDSQILDGILQHSVSVKIFMVNIILRLWYNLHVFSLVEMPKLTNIFMLVAFHLLPYKSILLNLEK